jgi:hypothetical protein
VTGPVRAPDGRPLAAARLAWSGVLAVAVAVVGLWTVVQRVALVVEDSSSSRDAF